MAFHGVRTALVFLFICLWGAAWCYTAEETNDVLTVALDGVRFFGGDSPSLEGRDLVETPWSWHGFLGEDEPGGWTLQEKKQAFLWYVNRLATNDWRSCSSRQKRDARIAIRQCRNLRFVEAIPAMRTLVLSPSGVYKEYAVDLVVNEGELDGSMVSFMDDVMTNAVFAGTGTRLLAIRGMVDRLLRMPVRDAAATNVIHSMYLHRQQDVLGSIALDELLTTTMAGYQESSNRLVAACHLLNAASNASPEFIAHFTAVTNQLLSSGQPLRQLTIGAGAGGGE